MFQVNAQNLESVSSDVTDKATSVKAEAVPSTNSLIDSFAADQVSTLTKKLNLDKGQQEQVTSLIVSQLKTDKYSKLLSSATDNAVGSSSMAKQKGDLTKALYTDPSFQKKLSSILTKDQNIKLQDSMADQKG